MNDLDIRKIMENENKAPSLQVGTPERNGIRLWSFQNINFSRCSAEFGIPKEFARGMLMLTSI